MKFSLKENNVVEIRLIAGKFERIDLEYDKIKVGCFSEGVLSLYHLDEEDLPRLEKCGIKIKHLDYGTYIKIEPQKIEDIST